jgi:antirestriction protein ArdC
MLSPNEIRHRITNQIVEALTNGNLPPWRKPWRSDRNAGSRPTPSSHSTPILRAAVHAARAVKLLSNFRPIPVRPLHPNVARHGKRSAFASHHGGKAIV